MAFTTTTTSAKVQLKNKRLNRTKELLQTERRGKLCFLNK